MSLTMGLRADQAREILKSNRYTENVYAYGNNACNDGSGYLYGLSTPFGAFVGTAVGKAIQCSTVWMNDPSCELKNPIIYLAIGGILGLVIPICLLKSFDRNETSKADRINELRKHVMKIIDDNYRDCAFHSPLKGTHISELLRLTDEDTQEQLLSQLNGVQVTQALKDQDVYSEQTLHKIQNKSKVNESLTEVEWEDKVITEIKSWDFLKTSLMNNTSEGISEAYAVCKNAFGDVAVDTFVEKYITIGNLKSVHELKLSAKLAQSCNNYYQEHKKEIDVKNFF